MTKGQNELNFALGEGFKLARVITRGAGLSMAQQFEALSSKGAQKAFTNECFVCGTFKKGVWGVELLSRDFKHKVFVPKDKVEKIDILARDLKGLQAVQNTDNKMQRIQDYRHTEGFNPEVSIQNTECRIRGVDTSLRSV